MDAPIRLSGPTLKVLNDLLRHERNGRSGADITRATKVPPGTIYPLLTRLKAAGWIVDRWEEGAPSIMKRPKRRLYWLTGEGQLRARTLLNELWLGA